MNIVGILGSPTAVSRSGSLLQLAQSRISALAHSLHTVSVRSLPAEPLLHARADHPAIREALSQVACAQVVLVSTPIYKAAYSGMLKTFLDLLPQDGLRDKTVLPLATGGSVAHLLALEFTLKPVLSALGARDILDPVFATDAQIAKTEQGGYVPSTAVQHRIDRALQSLFDRAEELQRREVAERERAALMSRVALVPCANGH